MARALAWDALPLFADDKAIGAALLGPDRAGEFKGQAALLEPKGFPTIDARFGGRYVPAVKAYFDLEYGLSEDKPQRPGGPEDPTKWKNPIPARSFPRRA